MDPRDATDLIRDAVAGRTGTWLDLGSGDGAFTRVLAACLGTSSRIVAVDRDQHAIAALEQWAHRDAPQVSALVADFTRPFELPGLSPGDLDGMLLANALHYALDPRAVLARLVPWLRQGGRLVVIEYDRRLPNPWVPFPIRPAKLETVAAAVGLAKPVIRARKASAYGGELYVATADCP